MKVTVITSLEDPFSVALNPTGHKVCQHVHMILQGDLNCKRLAHTLNITITLISHRCDTFISNMEFLLSYSIWDQHISVTPWHAVYLIPYRLTPLLWSETRTLLLEES